MITQNHYGSLDTNVVVRLILNDKPREHKAAMGLLVAGQRLAIADTVFVELAVVLTRDYEFSREQVVRAIKTLMQSPFFNCNHVLLDGATSLYVQFPKLSFEDCCLATYAELQHAQPLWTFDKKLAKQAPSARLVQVK